MKKKLTLVFLALMLFAFCLPMAGLGEIAPTKATTEATTEAPLEVPTETVVIADPVPAAGYSWSSLAGVAGATAFTLLLVQFIKAPLDKVWRIPTRALVYMIAFATLLIAQIFTAGFTMNGLALTAVNAVIAASAAMGAYEMTFAKTSKQTAIE